MSTCQGSKTPWYANMIVTMGYVTATQMIMMRRIVSGGMSLFHRYLGEELIIPCGNAEWYRPITRTIILVFKNKYF